MMSRLRQDVVLGELYLQVLGALRLQDAAGEEIRITSRKARALLAYLAIRAGATHSRQQLSAMLWEEADEELARTSLRQVLTVLRKAMRVRAALRVDAESVALDTTVVVTDLAAFRDALAAGTRASFQDAIARYRGELLEGFDARSSTFDEWLSSQRIVLRQQMSDALQQLTQLCAANDDTDGALNACSRLVALEPLNEAAHRTLMRLHAARYRYTEALQQYRRCRAVLRRELDVAPDPATEQLYRALMRQRRAALATDPVSGPLSSAGEPAAPSDPAPQAELDVAAMRSGRIGLRDAAILVVRLEGLLGLEARLDPEESHALSLAFQNRVQDAVREFGGLADHRVGSNVVAVFGLPVARGNEAERAAGAALRLRDGNAHQPWPVAASAADSLSLRFGIAVGQIVCTAEPFPISGQTAHLAHALASQAANGEILVSEELRHALADRAQVEPHAGIGDQDSTRRPISSWRLQALRRTGADPRPFVGRRPELAMALAALDRCANERRGRTVVLRGEAGIGKTRLLDTIRDAAHRRGVAVHAAQIFDFGQSLARRPITALALSLLEICADAPMAERSRAVHRLCCEQGNIDQIIFLSELIDAPLDAERSKFAEAMDIAVRRRGRMLALARLIESAAQRTPLMLIIEDAHWADSEEAAQSSEIAATIAGCAALLVLSTRPEGDPIDTAWRARARNCPITTIDLAPLTTQEAQALAAHYPRIAPAATAACIRRAEGYPLFLDQLLRTATAGFASLPGSVRAIVAARVDRLSAQDRLAAHAAAVLGHRVAVRPLRHMIADEHYQPTRLLEAGLVYGDGAELAFTHALFRDAIYESLLKSQRCTLHRAAAEWFAGNEAALCADHLAAAGDERAASAYLDAAVGEQGGLRLERALALASKGASLARERALLYRSRLLLGELKLQSGLTHEALAAYREALDAAVGVNELGAAIGGNEQGQAWFGIASALRVLDRHQDALEALDRAEAAMGTTIDARSRARLCTLRGNLCFPLGRLDACLQAHEQAHRLALQAESPADIARALGGLGDAYYQRGRMLTAGEYFSQCVRQAREHDLLAVLLAYLPMLALTQSYGGNPSAARPGLDEAIELARRIADRRGELLARLCMAAALQMQSRMEECRDCALRALELAAQLGAQRFEAEALSTIAITLLASDRTEALRLGEQALRVGRDTGNMSYCGPVLLSIVARITENARRRAELLAEGEALLKGGCVSHCYLEFYAHAIEVGLATHAWQDTRRYAFELQAYTAAEPLPLTDLFIRRARLLADLGEHDDAGTRQALGSLGEECRRMKVFAALPAIEAALQAAPV